MIKHKAGYTEANEVSEKEFDAMENVWSCIRLFCAIVVCFCIAYGVVALLMNKVEAQEPSDKEMLREIKKAVWFHGKYGLPEPEGLVFDNYRKPIKIGATPEQQEKVDYAWEISKDIEFIYTVEGENSLWTHDRKHNLPYYLCWNMESWDNGHAPNQLYNRQKCIDGTQGWFWREHQDWGYCGTGDGYKKHIVDDERFFTDWRWQMGQCWEMYRTGTTFHGKNNIWFTKTKFIF